MQCLGYAGRIPEAIAIIDDIKVEKASGYVKVVVVNTLITAGRYQRALTIKVPVDGQHSGLFANALNEVNLAEAEYNLGRWSEALARVDSIQCSRSQSSLVASGAAAQRAWILAHLGQMERARASFAEVRLADFPAYFKAEPHYTKAAIELAAGELDAALEAVALGLQTAVRASSKRNGLFLRARIRAGRGEHEQALADFEIASKADYRWQGGDGLLAWGDLLQRMGRSADAARAWQLTVERDPESESAALATQRLAEAAPAQQVVGPAT